MKYFVSYAWIGKDKDGFGSSEFVRDTPISGFGSSEFVRDTPISGFEDLRKMEEAITKNSTRKIEGVVILNFVLFDS